MGLLYLEGKKQAAVGIILFPEQIRWKKKKKNKAALYINNSAPRTDKGNALPAIQKKKKKSLTLLAYFVPRIG